MATDLKLKLKLFVYVIGLGGCSFPVIIKGSETVGELKKAILKKVSNELRGVDADQLVLYKVELPDADGDTLQQSAPQASHEELEVPSEELSQLFPIEIPEETISIVVEIQRPSE